MSEVSSKTYKVELENLERMIGTFTAPDQKIIRELSDHLVDSCKAQGPVLGGLALCLANATFMMEMEAAREARRLRSQMPNP